MFIQSSIIFSQSNIKKIVFKVIVLLTFVFSVAIQFLNVIHNSTLKLQTGVLWNSVSVNKCAP